MSSIAGWREQKQRFPIAREVDLLKPFTFKPLKHMQEVIYEQPCFIV